MTEPVAEWSGVDKTYRRGWSRARALEGFDYTVQPGEIQGLLGPNGSGKTTAVLLLLDIVQPDSGRVRLFGQPPANPDSRREVGYLPESFDSFPSARVDSLLTSFARLKYTPGAPVPEHVNRVIEQLNLGPYRERRFASLSWGLRQRVGLAQALLGRPRLLILDEPTTGLDPETQKRFYDLMDRRLKDGHTTLLITHRLEEVRRLCTRVDYVREGRIDPETPPEDLLEGTLDNG